MRCHIIETASQKSEQQPNAFMGVVGLVFVEAISICCVGVLAIGCNQIHDDADENAVRVTADQLAYDYANNNHLADEKYYGKWLLVSGNVHSYSPDDGRRLVMKVSPARVECDTMPLRDAKELAKLNVGDPVRVFGAIALANKGDPNLGACELR